jgi:hypothetical protein
MNHELGPEARSLLDAARGGLGPDAAAIRRMRAKIDASIAGGGAAAGASAQASTGAAAGGGAGVSGLAVKLGAAVVAATLAIGAVVYVRGRGDAPASEPRVAETAVRAEPAAKAPPREVAPAVRAAEVEPEIEMAPEIVAEPSRPAAAAKPAAPVSTPREAAPPAGQASAPAAAAPPPSPPRADLAREVTLVDQAMAALRRGDAAAALAAVGVHAAETGGAGQLAEDAAAIEIEALCRLRAPSVAQKLAAFDAKWPESAQRSRLTSRCP